MALNKIEGPRRTACNIVEHPSWASVLQVSLALDSSVGDDENDCDGVSQTSVATVSASIRAATEVVQGL